LERGEFGARDGGTYYYPAARSGSGSDRQDVPGVGKEGVAADPGTADGCATVIRAVITYICSAAASATTEAALRVDAGVVHAID
jgi:hypothetical protein